MGIVMNRTEFIRTGYRLSQFVLLGLWAAYTFVFAEYVKYQILDGFCRNWRETPLKNKLIPIHLKISAHNGGSRQVYIEYAYFELYGEKINELQLKIR